MDIIKYPDKNAWGALMSRCTTDTTQIDDTVSKIVESVKTGGDNILRQLSEKFDGFIPNSFEVSEESINEACTKVNTKLKEAIDVASKNITSFHKAQLRTQPVIAETMPGVKCEQRVMPIERIGLYIPGGRAPLFSTVLMLAIPARIAGCREIVMCTPPHKDGSISSEILYAARVAGVDTVYALGGAQAIAAMAYGTESIKRVYKIFGPGNRFVTRAKQIVAADCVAIDMPAGPSEVMIMADDSTDPTFVAADILSQAEHGPDSQGIVICLDEVYANRIQSEVERLTDMLSRKEILSKSLENCRIIVLKSRQDMIDFANEYAAEHLIIATREAEDVSNRITAAGSIFIGAYSPESAGDYASGTNHTLPTGGWALSMNGVNTDSFLRRITLQHLEPEGLKLLAPTIQTMAFAEGLDAHAMAVSVRMNYLNAKS